jgi:hypothetical protein
MAALSAGDRTTLKAEAMRELSRRRISTDDVTKDQVDSVIASIDDALDAAETASVTSLPVGNVRTWLTNNPSAGRRLMILVEQKRREVL